jgi:hypothetical protein
MHSFLAQEGSPRPLLRKSGFAEQGGVTGVGAQGIECGNPTFGSGHIGLAWAYWGARKYPEMIQEFRTYAQVAADKNYTGYIAALDDGYRSGGWPSAARKTIEVLIAQR